MGTTESDFRAFADALEQVNQEGHVVVMGAPDTIAKANDPDAWLDVLSIM